MLITKENYFTSPEHFKKLKDENLIAFKYCDEKGQLNDDSNHGSWTILQVSLILKRTFRYDASSWKNGR